MQRTALSPHEAMDWHAEAQTDRIAHVVTADGTLLAVVVDGIGEPGRALPWARLMAAAPELVERLGDLLVDVALLTDGEPSHAEIMATVSLSVLRANALLVRLAEATP